MGIKVGKAAAAAQVVWPRHEEGIEVGGGEKEAEKVYKTRLRESNGAKNLGHTAAH